MAQIKLAEYTFDNTIEADCLPNIKPDTIIMTSSDSVDGNITTTLMIQQCLHRLILQIKLHY